jgi:signal transduction histidine kinase
VPASFFSDHSRAMPGPAQAQKRLASRLACLLVVIAALCVAAKPLDAAEPRRILLLHAYNYTLPQAYLLADAARERLNQRSPQKIELYGENLDLIRFPEAGQQQLIADFLRERYAQKQPHLVMVLGGEALPFVVRHRAKFAPGVPVVFVGTSRVTLSTMQLPADVTGHAGDQAATVGNTLALAERLQPSARRLYIIAGSGPNDRRWQEIVRTALGSRLQKFETTYLYERSYDELLAEVSQIPRDSIVIMLTVIRDRAGRLLIPWEVTREVLKVSQAPIYSPHIFPPVQGLIGGFIETDESMARVGADIALEVLDGKNPATIPPRAAEGHYRVDHRALQRFGLSESDLPAGTVVLNKELTLWDQYRAQVIGAAAIVLLQTALIAGLLIERERRRRAAARAETARAETGQYRENLAHLARVHTAGEMSTAIAHEVNQPLAAIKNYAFAARLRLAGGFDDPAKFEELLDKIETQASRAGDVLHSLRAMMKKHESEPARVEVGQLIADTLKLVEMETRKGDIRLETSIAPDLPPVFVDGIQIQQVVLNLTRNAIEAMDEAGQEDSVITVGVRGNGHGEIAVSVADRGPGIAPDDTERIFDPFYSTKAGGLGVGLSLCRAIIEAHGGRLWLNPNAGGGSIFQFTLPAMKMG